ncbi:MAG TPA: hypothetical protein VNK05_04145, partial [Chloroflexota bacterium]|nr:hypothetical protein [Chloroflexota bacterium]
MERRPALAVLAGLGALAVSGPPARAGGGGPPDVTGPVVGPDWEPAGLTEPAVQVVLSGATPYAVTRPGGGAPDALWRGSPAGGAWARLTAPVATIRDLAVDPGNAALLFVAGDGGVHRSVDGGAAWQRVVVPPSTHDGLRVAVSAADPALVYATTGEASAATVWRSENGGAGWAALRELQGTLCFWTFPVVAPDPAVRERIYVSSSCAAGRTFFGTLQVSDDLWATPGRTILTPSVSSTDPLALLFPEATAFDPTGRRGVVAARRDPRSGGGAVVATENGGASWRVLLNFPPPPRQPGGGAPVDQGTVTATLLAGLPGLRRLV